MRKTSLYLTEEDQELLKHLADTTHSSQAQVLREALALYAVRTLSTSQEFALFGVAEGPGDSVKDIPEGDLLKGFGE